MEYFGTDILENILFRLPVDAGIQAKRVCKTWREILRSKTEETCILFAHCYQGIRVHEQFCYEDEYGHDYAHPKMMMNYNFDKEKEYYRIIMGFVRNNVMVGSCNEYNYSEELPQEISTARSESGTDFDDSGSGGIGFGRLVSGFGYCSSTNAYKVVTILYRQEEREGDVRVYTVGTREWRYIGFNDRCAFNYASGVYANGALFWVHPKYKVQESEVVAFDLEGEKFHYIALPPTKDFEYLTSSYPLKLLGANNNLYLVHRSKASCADIWVYKRDNRDTMKECDGEPNYLQGRISSHWLKEFSLQLDFPYFFKPFTITRSNAVLWYDRFGMSLYWYDHKASTLNKLRDIEANGTGRIDVEAIPHTRSIVSLKDFGEDNVTCLKDLVKLCAKKRKSDLEKLRKKWARITWRRREFFQRKSSKKIRLTIRNKQDHDWW